LASWAFDLPAIALETLSSICSLFFFSEFINSYANNLTVVLNGTVFELLISDFLEN
jgi:hypothetical protein